MYRYLNNIWSWDKDNSTQHEMVISIMYSLLQNIKANYEKESFNGLKCLNNCRFWPLVN